MNKKFLKKKIGFIIFKKLALTTSYYLKKGNKSKNLKFTNNLTEVE